MAEGKCWEQLINEAAQKGSVISLRASLVAGTSQKGDAKQFVLPSTYADIQERHAMSPRRPDGTHEFVIIDSQQSFVNRLEELLAREELKLPRVETEVDGKLYGVFDLPHRGYDATLLDSELEGTVYKNTAVGRAILSATPANATALYQYAPSMLLFGGWDSHDKSRMGAKITTALSAHILGFNATPMPRNATRIDPLGITKDAGPVYPTPDGRWSFNPDESVKNEKGQPTPLKPSEVGHSSVPSNETKGVWVTGMELRASLSLARLRRYRFPVDGKASAELDAAARSVLAALAVYLLAARLDAGLDLRSGADLVAESADWHLRTGLSGDQPLSVSAEGALCAYRAALSQAERLGLTFGKSVTLKASERLAELVRRSARGNAE